MSEQAEDRRRMFLSPSVYYTSSGESEEEELMEPSSQQAIEESTTFPRKRQPPTVTPTITRDAKKARASSPVQEEPSLEATVLETLEPPKKPPTAYTLWRKKHGKLQDFSTDGMDFQEYVDRHNGKTWRELDASEREPFESQEADHLCQYSDEKDAYHEQIRARAAYLREQGASKACALSPTNSGDTVNDLEGDKTKTGDGNHQQDDEPAEKDSNSVMSADKKQNGVHEKHDSVEEPESNQHDGEILAIIQPTQGPPKFTAAKQSSSDAIPRRSELSSATPVVRDGSLGSSSRSDDDNESTISPDDKVVTLSDMLSSDDAVRVEMEARATRRMAAANNDTGVAFIDGDTGSPPSTASSVLKSFGKTLPIVAKRPSTLETANHIRPRKRSPLVVPPAAKAKKTAGVAVAEHDDNANIEQPGSLLISGKKPPTGIAAASCQSLQTTPSPVAREGFFVGASGRILAAWDFLLVVPYTAITNFLGRHQRRIHMMNQIALLFLLLWALSICGLTFMIQEEDDGEDMEYYDDEEEVLDSMVHESFTIHDL